MAEVRPFRGVTYDPARVDLARVLCPPYDVISPRQQAAYMARDDKNAVRLVLNPAEGAARYTEAATALDRWLGDGTLRRAGAPAFYVHRHTFTGPEGATARLGLLAAVRLEPWSSGAVKPHEHTMPGPKEDRLQLMRATEADTEPIWVFHPDPGRELHRRIVEITLLDPLFSVDFAPEPSSEETPEPERHELWEVTEPEIVADLADQAARVQLYIADGHHRYETALHHAEEKGGGPDHATRFKVMLLTATDDQGLLVLPTHRLVKVPPGRSLGGLMSGLAAAGWVTEQPASLTALQARLATPAPAGRAGFGMLSEKRYSYIEGPVDALPGQPQPPSIAALEVSALHDRLLEPLLGIGAAELAAGGLVAYTRDVLEARARVVSGEFDMAFFLRAPSLAQVQAVADAGENMPQKSTYFWPKPASGLVLALQRDGEPI